MVQDRQSGTDYEVQGEMAPQVAKKPTVEFNGYQRTITDVVRIRQSEKGDDPADVSVLLEGLDSAIKDCRVLRKRLERLHRKRRTGLYQTVPKPEPVPQT